MYKIAIFFYVFIAVQLHAQNHAPAISKINTIEDARIYASENRGVNFDIVNKENDAFLFDDIDTSNIHVSVGKTITLFGRSTKFIQDTLICMVNVQTIVFDLTKTSKDMADLLLNQIKKRLAKGETYWELKRKYSHTSAMFISGPIPMDEIIDNYQLNLKESEEGSQFEIDNVSNKIGVLIVAKIPHRVLAFHSISYNSIK